MIHTLYPALRKIPKNLCTETNNNNTEQYVDIANSSEGWSKILVTVSRSIITNT